MSDSSATILPISGYTYFRTFSSADLTRLCALSHGVYDDLVMGLVMMIALHNDDGTFHFRVQRHEVTRKGVPHLQDLVERLQCFCQPTSLIAFASEPGHIFRKSVVLSRMQADAIDARVDRESWHPASNGAVPDSLSSVCKQLVLAVTPAACRRQVGSARGVLHICRSCSFCSAACLASIVCSGKCVLSGSIGHRQCGRGRTALADRYVSIVNFAPSTYRVAHGYIRAGATPVTQTQRTTGMSITAPGHGSRYPPSSFTTSFVHAPSRSRWPEEGSSSGAGQPQGSQVLDGSRSPGDFRSHSLFSVREEAAVNSGVCCTCVHHINWLTILGDCRPCSNAADQWCEERATRQS